VVDSLLAQVLAMPQNVLKKVTLSATQPVIFSICHKLIFQHIVVLLVMTFLTYFGCSLSYGNSIDEFFDALES